uniref:Secreted protein n=1 Tax=Caenorhabditis tropicalis TaxID=1561998 RepID=A0A1I7UYX4_9PELO
MCVYMCLFYLNIIVDSQIVHKNERRQTFLTNTLRADHPPEAFRERHNKRTHHHPKLLTLPPIGCYTLCVSFSLISNIFNIRLPNP